MVHTFVDCVCKPIIQYLDLTLKGPCRTLQKNQVARRRVAPKRRRKNSGIFTVIRQQRQMCSPEQRRHVCPISSVRDHYVRPTYVAPSNSKWLV